MGQVHGSFSGPRELPTLHTYYGVLHTGTNGDDGEAGASELPVIFDHLSHSMWAGLVLHKGTAYDWSVSRPVR